MKIHFKKTLLLFLLFFPFLLNAEEPKAGQCLFDGPPVKGTECGTLTVPMDHFKDTGRTIQLPYVRVQPEKGPSEDTPLIFLSGGPGQTLALDKLWQVKNWRDFARAIKSKREVIFIEMRGSPLAKPSFGCARLVTKDLYAIDDSKEWSIDFAEKRFDKRLDACLAKIKAGPNAALLRTVNRHQIAHDINELRNDLKVDKIALWGVSYGSTYAMTIMEAFPDIVSEVLLDAVFPPEATKDVRHSLVFQSTYNTRFERCSMNTKCYDFAADLEHEFYSLLLSLLTQPSKTVKAYYPDRRTYYQISAHDYFAMLTALLYYSSSREDFKYLVRFSYSEQAAQKAHRYSKVQFIREFIFDSFFFTVKDIYTSTPPFIVASCYDRDPDFVPSDKSKVANILDLFTYFDNSVNFYSLCDDWNPDFADNSKRNKLISDIPTLIVAGGLDPITPPYLAKMAQEGLSNSYYFEFENEAHGVIGFDKCANKLTQQFLSDPHTKPDDECLLEAK